MAHTFLSVRNYASERTLAVTDSLLHLFIYFFNEKIIKDELEEMQLEIYNHYYIELLQMNNSFIDLKLQEIFNSNNLRTWYLSNLSHLTSSIEFFGDFLDNNELNKIDRLKKEYARPIKVIKLKNLINDINWLLCKENISPSAEFKWFENDFSGASKV